MFFRYLILITGIATAISAQANDAVELRSGLLINMPAAQVYLMQPAGGVEAVAVANGATRWRSDSADQPLSLQQNLLLLQIDTQLEGRMDLAWIDVDTGRVESTEAVTLPKGVIPRVNQGLGQEFDHRLTAAGDLIWEQRSRPVRGMPSEQPAPLQRQAGAVSLSGGSIAALAPPDPQTVSALWQAQSPEVPASSPGQRRFRAAGGDAILVSREDADASIWERYEWTVVGAEGKVLGQFRSHMSYSPFVVLDGVLLYVTQPLSRQTADRGLVSEPLMLRAIDLATGQQVWARELRDTRYQGPYPA
ncbi:MAG: hypothetical protein AAGB27_15640 [Pseudomonadota bacterium]